MLYVQQRLPTCVEGQCQGTQSTQAQQQATGARACQVHGMANARHWRHCNGREPFTMGRPSIKALAQTASRVMPPRHNCPQWLGCLHRPRRPHTADNSNSLSCYLLRCLLALPHVAAPHTLRPQPPGCKCGCVARGLELRGPTVNCLGGGRAEAARHAINHSVGKPHSP